MKRDKLCRALISINRAKSRRGMPKSNITAVCVIIECLNSFVSSSVVETKTVYSII